MEIVLGLILLCGVLMVALPRVRRGRARGDPRRRGAAAAPRAAATPAAPPRMATLDGEMWEDDLGWIDEPATSAAAPAPEPIAPPPPVPAASEWAGRTWDRA